MNTSDNFTDSADWLLRTIRKNPEGLLLLGAGAALLLRGTGRPQQRRMGSSSDYPQRMPAEGPYGPYGMSGTDQTTAQAGGTASMSAAADQAGNAGARVVDAATDRLNQVQTQAKAAVSSAMESGQKAVDSAMQSGQRIASSALQSGQTMVNSIAAQPLLVALLGIGTGLALASLLPETEIEHRAFGDAGKNLAQTAQEVGSKVASATAETADKLSESASQRGFTKEGVQGLAGELAETFTTALRDQPKEGESAERQPAGQGTEGSRS